MAKKPDFFGEVNQITRFFINPCDAPTFVWIETAIPALELAILEYFTPSIMDIWRGFFRPKQALRGFRKSRGPRKRKRGPGLPDFGEEFGSRLPGADAFHGRQVSNGVLHMWVFYEKIEAVLWYIMVIEIVTKFFYNWTSAMIKTEYCQAANYDRCLNIKTFPQGQSGNWEGVGFGDQIYSHPQDFGFDWTYTVNSADGGAVLAGTGVPLFPGDEIVGAQVALIATYPDGSTEIFDSGPGVMDKEGLQMIVAAPGGLPKGTQLASAAKCGPGGGPMQVNACTFSAWSNNGNTHAGYRG